MTSNDVMEVCAGWGVIKEKVELGAQYAKTPDRGSLQIWCNQSGIDGSGLLL